MFSASAELYDLIYGGFKNYQAEAGQLAEIIHARHPSARRLLDVACGTGEHARLLSAQHGFHVDGLDLDPGFVRIARRKLPDSTVYEADMSEFALPGRYDVVLCLFSSIGYLRSADRVRSAFRCFRDHLAAGGLVIVEPWFGPGALLPGRVFLKTAESAEVSVCRMSHTEIDGRLSRLRFEYLIGRPSGIERATEIHELGLFTVDEMLSCFRDSGLHAEHEAEGPSGRGLYIARAA